MLPPPARMHKNRTASIAPSMSTNFFNKRSEWFKQWPAEDV
jgi:hypothetical protein